MDGYYRRQAPFEPVGEIIGKLLRHFLTKGARERQKLLQRFQQAYGEAQLTGDKTPLSNLVAETPEIAAEFKKRTGIEWPAAPTGRVGPPTRAEARPVPWPTTAAGMGVRATQEQLAGRQPFPERPPDIADIVKVVQMYKGRDLTPEEWQELTATGKVPKAPPKRPEVEVEKLSVPLLKFLHEGFKMNLDQITTAYESGKIPSGLKPRVAPPDRPDLADVEKFLKVFGKDHWQEYLLTGKIPAAAEPIDVDPGDRKKRTVTEIMHAINAGRAAGRTDVSNIMAEIDEETFDYGPYIAQLNQNEVIKRLTAEFAIALRTKNVTMQDVLAQQLAKFLYPEITYEKHKTGIKKLLKAMFERQALEETAGITATTPEEYIKQIK